MGPGQQHANNLPSCPRFSWEANSASWTDGKGDQEEYFNNLKLWEAFNEELPDTNGNKIPATLRAICLKSELYGRAKDICAGIKEDILLTVNGVKNIVDYTLRRDALSVVSEAYRIFNELVNCRRCTSETKNNYESQFAAQIAKFNEIRDIFKLHEGITALMLLKNSAMHYSQLVSVMAATASNDPKLGSHPSNS